MLRRRTEIIRNLTAEIVQLLADLKTTMLEQDGIGLAANQIGESVAAIAVNPQAAEVDMEPCCLINPELVTSEGRIEAEEGCLSFPGVYEVVSRPSRVKVLALDERGKPVEIEASGLLARALVHEIDHARGILFIDHIGSVRRKMLAGRLQELEEREKRECG